MKQQFRRKYNGVAKSSKVLVYLESYRARYESEGCKGPIHGSTENGFPSIKIFGIVGEVVLTIFVVTRDNEPHLHSAKGPGSSKYECKEVRLPNGVQALQTTLNFNNKSDEALIIFDQLSIRRARNWEADKELRDRGIEPVLWKTKKKEAKLAFQVSISSINTDSIYQLKCYSRPFQCTAPSGNPEIYWSSHTEGSSLGGLEMGFHGKKFASGFKIRFFSKDSNNDPPWEEYADVDRNKSSLHACVFKVPAYFETSNTTNVSVFIEVQSGSEKEPRTSEPVLFTYLADSQLNNCKTCVQLKGFIQTIHQLLISKHNFKGILDFIKNVIKEHNIITQDLENSLFENNSSEVSVESPLAAIKSKIICCKNEKRDLKIIDSFGFSSKKSANHSNKVTPKTAVFGRASPIATYLDVSQNKLFYTGSNRNEQASFILNNAPTHSKSFAQSRSNSLFFPKKYQNENTYLKREWKDDILGCLAVSDIRNVISGKVLSVNSKLLDTSCEDKKIINKLFSTTLLSNSNCDERLTFSDCLHNQEDLSSYPTQFLQYNLSPESFQLKPLDNEMSNSNLFCSNAPSLKCLQNDQVIHQDSHCEENLLIDKYSLQKHQAKHQKNDPHIAIRQEFEYDFQPLLKSYENTLDQIVQPRSYVLCHEPEHALNQHKKLNAILTQNNFPSSSNWHKRQNENFTVEYNFNNSPHFDPNLSFEESDSFFKVLDYNEPTVISSTSRPTFCSGDLNFFNSLSNYTMALTKLEQTSYPQCFFNANLIPISSPVSW